MEKTLFDRLKESEEQNRAILENVVDAILTINEDAIVQSMNPSAERIFGYNRSEVIGKNVNMLMPEPYHSEHNTYLKSYLTTGQAKIIGIGREVEARRKDGTVFPIYLAVSEVRLEGKRLFTGIIRDITEQKALERARADLYAMVTHDIKAPLTVIMGFAELIRDTRKDALDADTLEMVEAIGRNADKIMDLVEDFLTSTRLESGRLTLKLEAADLSQLVRDVHEQSVPLAKTKGVLLSAELCDGMPGLFLDKKYVARAISNLVVNAINYTANGGSVLIKTGRAAAGPDLEAFVSVSDTGMGVPEEERLKIFEKYYRSPGVAGVKGSGLGLAIAKAVAEAHGGRIELDSKPGEGSTFRLVLPVKVAGRKE